MFLYKGKEREQKEENFLLPLLYKTHFSVKHVYLYT